jgi:ribosomal protein S18 acetylase RimI-like enzyme
MTAVVVRAYAPADEPSLYDVCLRTGDAGSDASGLVTDPRLFGEVYVGPYLELERRFALVADDGERAAGYALAALSTADFERSCEQRWWPPLRERYPLHDGAGRTPTDAELVAAIHRPELVAHPDLPDFPSHLHIDLLEHVRGGGVGRRMLTGLFGLLAAAGSTGVHLGVDVRNLGAQRFYRRLGFTDLMTDDAGVLYQGRRLPAGQA